MGSIVIGPWQLFSGGLATLYIINGVSPGEYIDISMTDSALFPTYVTYVGAQSFKMMKLVQSLMPPCFGFPTTSCGYWGLQLI